MVLLWSVIATLAVSLVSFAGLFFLSSKQSVIKKIILSLVAFAAGSMLGAAFLHLIPEAAHEFDGETVFLYTLVGFILFLLVEKILHWRHCHRSGGECQIHKNFATLNLLGDGLHNFIDGLLIAASFSVSWGLGWVTTLAVLAHELPQEIGDFGVLLYSGLSRARALWLNFLSALTAVLGAVVGVWLAGSYQLAGMLLPIAAGGFLYIAAVDLIPELRQDGHNWRKSLLSFALFLAGIAVMWFFKELTHQH